MVVGETPGVAGEYQVRLFAAAREAAGAGEARIRTERPRATVGGLSEALCAEFGPQLSSVLRVSSLLVDGVVLSFERDAAVQLPNEAQIDVLPPFAGG